MSVQSNMLLHSSLAEELYQSVRGLPIIDYHCHISSEEIYYDKQFENISQMWLKSDHYKWRLMRSAGVDEHFITGNANDYEKFFYYVKAVEQAINNPLYLWSHMELQQFFQSNLVICESNAKKIWDQSLEYIKIQKLSPRKLIFMSNVEYIATTDDICDSLEYHCLLKQENYPVIVAPSFRVDSVLLIQRAGYTEYIQALSQCSGVYICNLFTFQQAICTRLEYFVEHGCKFSDSGITYFPNTLGSFEEADTAFRKALNQESISDNQYHAFLGQMYLFLAGIYKKHHIIMQLHVAVMRNINTKMRNLVGADSGFDCIGETIPLKNIVCLFNELTIRDALPKTICYTLNPQMYYGLATVIGSFKDVCLGAAWWFNDHKRGIEEQLTIYSETDNLSTFMGMLTDSRSFLSYSRHDYFRRVLCNYVAEKLNCDEFYGQSEAIKIIRKICYENSRTAIQDP